MKQKPDQSLYQQCNLSRQSVDDAGVLCLETMVSWIPEEIARKGNIVRLKDNETAEWTEGWTVENENNKDEAMPLSMLQKNSRDHLKTREASDI